MKGIIVEAVGSPYKVVEDLKIPEPTSNQILVKSISTAINPVDTFMQGTGLLVTAWPIVLGCDASGIVVKSGDGASSTFKAGDRVCGCTRLGIPGFSTFQQYFVMDAKLALPLPQGLSLQQGATLGVGTYTACLGLLGGLKLDVPDSLSSPPVRDEWVVVLGGAGSVGQYSIQIAKALGYKIVATCSLKTATHVRDLGADAVIDFGKDEDDQLQELRSITRGNFFGVWDSVAKSEQMARKALKTVSILKQKVFATTDDWTPMGEDEDHETCRVKLGLLGREGDDIKDAPGINEELASYIPFLTRLLDAGKLRPNRLRVVSTGFEGIPEAIDIQQMGTCRGEKVVVDLQSE